MRGNRTESLWEENLPPRGAPKTLWGVHWSWRSQKGPLGGRFSSRRLSVLLPLIMLPLNLSKCKWKFVFSTAKSRICGAFSTRMWTFNLLTFYPRNDLWEFWTEELGDMPLEKASPHKRSWQTKLALCEKLSKIVFDTVWRFLMFCCPVRKWPKNVEVCLDTVWRFFDVPLSTGPSQISVSEIVLLRLISQGKKKHININRFGGLHWDWVGGKNLCVCVCFSCHALWGRKAHKQNPPQNPGTILRNVSSFVFWNRFWPPPTPLY